jgi:two-component system response regulator DevR
MADAEQVTVYLVDDHELVREGLRSLLERGGLVVVGEAATVNEAVAGILATQPAVAILDVRLAGGSGVDICRRITHQAPDTACLMLTSYDNDDALFDAIAAGAAGYLLKQIRNLELVDTVKRVANGERLLDATATAHVLERLRFGPHHDPLLDGLSDRERRVLTLLGEGLSNRDIGERMLLTEKTIKNYVSDLLHKLGMQSRTQAALYVTSGG